MPDENGRPTLEEAMLALRDGELGILPATPDDPSAALVIIGESAWMELMFCDGWPAGRVSGVVFFDSGHGSPARWRLTGTIER